MDSDRYSFKIEFDCYEASGNYKGLDKLCLNNLIQDNTMMKDYITYKLMKLRRERRQLHRQHDPQLLSV